MLVEQNSNSKAPLITAKPTTVNSISNQNVLQLKYQGYPSAILQVMGRGTTKVNLSIPGFQKTVTVNVI